LNAGKKGQSKSVRTLDLGNSLSSGGWLRGSWGVVHVDAGGMHPEKLMLTRGEAGVEVGGGRLEDESERRLLSILWKSVLLSGENGVGGRENW